MSCVHGFLTLLQLWTWTCEQKLKSGLQEANTEALQTMGCSWVVTLVSGVTFLATKVQAEWNKAGIVSTALVCHSLNRVVPEQSWLLKHQTREQQLLPGPLVSHVCKSGVSQAIIVINLKAPNIGIAVFLLNANLKSQDQFSDNFHSRWEVWTFSIKFLYSPLNILIKNA